MDQQSFPHLTRHYQDEIIRQVGYACRPRAMEVAMALTRLRGWNRSSFSSSLRDNDHDNHHHHNDHPPLLVPLDDPPPVNDDEEQTKKALLELWNRRR